MSIPYLVLGMHKSGTTLVSRILHHSGVAMVESVLTTSYEEDNFYEREATYQLNLKLLNTEPDFLLLHAPPEQIYLTDAIHQEMIDTVRLLNQKYDRWGFKDPRTCLVYDAWRERVGEHRLIIVYRPVHDLWHRFDYKGLKIWRKVIHALRLVKRWCEYNQQILTIIQNTQQPYIVLPFVRLIADTSEIKRLEQFLAMPVSDERKPQQSKKRLFFIITVAIWLVKYTMRYDYWTIYEQLEHHHLEQV